MEVTPYIVSFVAPGFDLRCVSFFLRLLSLSSIYAYPWLHSSSKSGSVCIKNTPLASFVFHKNKATHFHRQTSPNWGNLPFLEVRRPARDLGRIPSRTCPFLDETQNYKVVVPSVIFPEHLESHQSKFERVRYAQNATAAQSSQKFFFCLVSSESVPKIYLWCNIVK